jgi:hypothetical protein
MAEKRTIELEIQDNSKSLKSQYKEAVAELQKVSAQYGETSKQAINAAKAAAQLKDQIAFSKDLVSSFNPDAKFDAVTKSIGGALNGFQAYEGAMGLIGVQNEELQKTMLKVQSAMALSQGIQGIGEAKDSFVALGTVIKSTTIFQMAYNFVQTGSIKATVASTVAKTAETTATVAQGAATVGVTTATTGATAALKLYRLALISTGIGALIVGVGLLIANFEKILGLFGPLIQGFKDFGDWIGLTSFKQDEEDKKAFKRAENRIAEINREKVAREKAQKAKETAYNNEDKALGRQIDLMKAQGKDTTALERARLKATINYQTNLQNESFAIFNQNKEKNKLILTELRAIAVREKDFTEYNKFLLSTSASQNELAAQNAAANEARKDAINALAIFEEETRKNAASSSASHNTQTTNNDVKTAETKIDIARRLEDESLRIREEGRQKELDALDIKYKRQKEDAEKELKDDKDKVNKLAALNAQAVDSRKADEKIIKDKYDKLEKDAAAKALEDKIKLQDEQWYALQKLKNSQQEQELLDLQIAYDKEYELAATNAELQKALTDKFNKDSAAINNKYKLEKAAADKLTADAEIANVKAVQEQKQAIQNQGIEVALQGVQLIKNVFEKSKGVQKAAVIAESAIGIAKMIIANKLANAGALATPQAIATSGAAAAPVIALNNISTGIGIAANIAATAKALNSLGGGSAPNPPGTGGGGGAGGGGSITPQFNTVGNNGINQLAQLQQQPTMAYVVSGQVTSQQALDRNRQQNSSL